MFDTPEIETYIQDCFPDVDGEKRVIRMRLYVNPISFELAQEVDPAIASTLFHKIAGEMVPRPILSHCRLASNIGPHSLTFCRDPKYANSRVFIPTVSITKLEAGKVTPESNQFALMFTVSFEKHDPKVLNDLSDLLHEKFYCTFAQLQAELPFVDPVMELLCRMCDAPNPEFATSDSKFAYCAQHEHQKQEGEILRRIRDHAAAMAAIGREPGDEDDEKPKAKDPLENDINKRNQMSRRKR